MMHSRLLLLIAGFACMLAFFVITVGAYTRLSDAGLGCPDWPGCYGQFFVPDEAEAAQVNAAYPERPLEKGKAWIEMAHRYIAGTLGFVIFGICVIAWRKAYPMSTRVTASLLAVLVIFQSLLGMWTVILLLKPVVVMLHLFGGMTILSLLYWLMLREQSSLTILPERWQPELFPFAVVGIVILILQILLGGWTSTNYAALACPDFPACQGSLWPNMDFREGFVLWRGLGVDYEGGVLDGVARTAIHMTHRLGAVLAFIVIAAVSIRSMLHVSKPIKLTGATILGLLFVQISLGIGNVVFKLPLWIAVAHNGVAALLLLSLVTLLHQTIPIKK